MRRQATHDAAPPHLAGSLAPLLAAPLAPLLRGRDMAWGLAILLTGAAFLISIILFAANNKLPEKH